MQDGQDTNGVTMYGPQQKPGVNNGVKEVAEEVPVYEGSFEISTTCPVGKTEKHYTDEREVGGYAWRLLIFPKGNQAPKFGDHSLSVFLDAPEVNTLPPAACPRAKFWLTLVHHSNPKLTETKDATHSFSKKETDWGFSQFISCKKLKDGWMGPEGEMSFQVKIKIYRNEEYNYFSRDTTGYVGLKNQGATCYMNSLLQTLFHIPFFRRAVYHMPTDDSLEASESLPLALQTLFYKLQFSSGVVSTKSLTKSFGWTQMDAFQQHDAQEFNRILCDRLEEKMKGTKAENAINKLFEGKTYSYIQCVNVDFRSTRTEAFMDLQLDVKDCKNLYDSFDQYVDVEMLQGDNQYQAEGYGMQDAKKGVLFESLPPVLQLHLKRFEYDYQKDIPYKINEKYEFYDKLELDGKYLSPDADKSIKNTYLLHSVLVHSGSLHTGHYFAYIRPDAQNWFKFDDEKVSKAEDKQAISEQFGGNDIPSMINKHQLQKFSNAYMLVYVRKSDWNSVMCEVTEDELSDNLRARFKTETKEKDDRRKEKMEAHLYTEVRVVTDQDLKEQIGSTRFFDIISSDQAKYDFKVRKSMTFLEFRQMIEEKKGVPLDKQRFWTWYKRQNDTYRLDSLQDNSVWDALTMRKVAVATTVKIQPIGACIDLYLENPQNAQVPQLFSPDTTIILFLKIYNPRTSKLEYYKSMYLKNTMKILDVRKFFMGAMKMSQLPLVLEETKFEPEIMMKELSDQKTLKQEDLMNGDILVIQEAVDPNDGYKYPTVKEYFEYIRYRKNVNFKPLNDPKSDGVWLELRRNMDYNTMTLELSQQLMLEDPHKLRITQHNKFTEGPTTRYSVRSNCLQKLENLLSYHNHETDILYYEVLDIPLAELEKLKILKAYFYDTHVKYVMDLDVRLPKDSSVKQLLEQVKGMVPEEYGDMQLRMVEISNSKLFKILKETENVEQLREGCWEFRVEALGPDDKKKADNDKLIQCCHVRPGMDKRQIERVYGDPFYLFIGIREALRDVKVRIARKLQVPEAEFSKWKFALWNSEGATYLKDDEVVANRMRQMGSWAAEVQYLAMEHEQKGGDQKRPANNASRAFMDRPITIKS